VQEDLQSKDRVSGHGANLVLCGTTNTEKNKLVNIFIWPQISFVFIPLTSVGVNMSLAMAIEILGDVASTTDKWQHARWFNLFDK
jgi:hypothetical protein